MLAFASEFFFGVLIGFVLGLLLNSIIYNKQLHNMRLLTKTLKSRKLSKTKPSANKFIRQISKRCGTTWDNNFHLRKCHSKFINYLEEKAIAASTIWNFYLQRTTPQKKTIGAIQYWIDEEKKKNVDTQMIIILVLIIARG